MEERIQALENAIRAQTEATNLLTQINDKHQKALLDIAKILDGVIKHLDLNQEFIKEILE